MSEENEIRELLARMSTLANRRDVDGLMALHNSSETAFLFGKQVTHEGNRRHCAQGYAALRGEFTYEFVPLKIEAGLEAAFAFGEERTKGANGSWILRNDNQGHLLPKED